MSTPEDQVNPLSLSDEAFGQLTSPPPVSAAGEGEDATKKPDDDADANKGGDDDQNKDDDTNKGDDDQDKNDPDKGDDDDAEKGDQPDSDKDDEKDKKPDDVDGGKLPEKGDKLSAKDKSGDEDKSGWS